MKKSAEYEALTRDLRREEAMANERARVDAVRAFGHVPEVCGPAIPQSPARGAFRVLQLEALYPKGEGEFELKPAGFDGRATMVLADVFDRMHAQSARKGGKLGLTRAQVEMGRLYARMVERHQAEGMGCSSFEAAPGGGGGSGGLSEAQLNRARRIELWHRRVGDGLAMEVKRVRKARPSAKVQRVTISALDLVNSVCVGDMEISKVLRRHGWSVYGETVKDCTLALGAILDRMAGPVRTGKIKALRTDLPPDFWRYG